MLRHSQVQRLPHIPLPILRRTQRTIHIEVDLHVRAVRLRRQHGLQGVEREVRWPGDGGGLDLGGGVEGVVPVVRGALPFADVDLGRPAGGGLKYNG